eukprot:TRINITY_DN62399_c0_g1_i1.p1 TRINITY_DN62399_c0_g1~~TRINITY_DN62399_c0_g1_i1.p1  ORF type:complete len:710 (+),score=120.40 TRINITY_DN62399_c0_g1_i1:156-2285(+)
MTVATPRVASPGGGLDRETPCTVGEFLNSVLVKEILAGQLLRLGRDESTWLEPMAYVDLVQKVVPSFAQDALCAAHAWIPAISDVTPWTLMPDIDQYPHGVKNLAGLNLVQRKLLLETLEVILDVLSSTDLDLTDGLNIEDVELPLLQRQGLACVASQIASAFEHLLLLRPASMTEVRRRDGGLDMTAWQQVCAAKDQPTPGSTQELVDELQRCRQRLFDLEKDLATQAKSAEALSNRGKRESDKAVARLLSVNSLLEEKLRSRTEEYHTAVKKCREQSRRIAHYMWVSGDKEARIKALEQDLAKRVLLQEDLLAREREYGRRVIRVQIEEYENLCRHDERIRRLQEIMDGKRDAQGGASCTVRNETDLSELSKKTLAMVMQEFDHFFDNRQARIEGVMRGHESLSTEQGKTSEGSQLQKSCFETVHVAVQTEPILYSRGKVEVPFASTDALQGDSKGISRQLRNDRRFTTFTGDGRAQQNVNAGGRTIWRRGQPPTTDINERRISSPQEVPRTRASLSILTPVATAKRRTTTLMASRLQTSQSTEDQDVVAEQAEESALVEHVGSQVSEGVTDKSDFDSADEASEHPSRHAQPQLIDPLEADAQTPSDLLSQGIVVPPIGGLASQGSGSSGFGTVIDGEDDVCTVAVALEGHRALPELPITPVTSKRVALNNERNANSGRHSRHARASNLDTLPPVKSPFGDTVATPT